MAVNLSMLAGAGAQFFDNNGNPLAGGKLYTYAAGTTTPQATYTTSAGNVAHANPIVLDSAGRVPVGGEIWLTDAVNYKFVLATSLDVTLGTYDNVAGNANGILAALAAPGGSALVGFLQAGTNAVARTAQSKMRDVVSVKDFGAVGDGVTNDTTAIQNAINAASLQKKAVYFPGGTYMVSNLTFRDTDWVGDNRNFTIIRAIAGVGDSAYLCASPAWLANGQDFIDVPVGQISDLTIDANSGQRQNAVVLRTYDSTILNCRIFGSSNADVLFSSSARDGTQSVGTMVNNAVKNCTIGGDAGTAQYGILIVDPNSKCTDYHINNNFITLNKYTSTIGLACATAAGWDISGNHIYGVSISAEINRPDIGTTCVDNYFENKVIFQGSYTGNSGPTFGPGNYCLDDVRFDFRSSSTNNPDCVTSLGNTYAVTANMIHNFFDPTKVLVSKADMFLKAQPFQFYSSGSPQSASTGIIKIIDATLTSIGRTISATITGSTASGVSVLQCPASWNSDVYSSPATLQLDNFQGAYPRRFKTRITTVAPLQAISLSIAMPDLLDDESYSMRAVVTQAQNHNGISRTAYLWEGIAIRKPGGAVIAQFANTVFTAGQWSVAPSFSFSSASGVLTVTFSGTVSTTDGYGSAYIELRQ